jgi:hypothetical protein
MIDKEYNGEPMDAGWQSPPWNNDGETIEAYNTDESGNTMTVNWPENATRPEHLNEKQRQMIRTAVKYPELESPSKLVRRSGLDVSKHYPKHVLRRHWPERYWGETPESERVDGDRTEVSESIESLRKRALNGESAAEIAKSLGVSSQPIQRRLKGSREFSGRREEECQIPPLEYDAESSSWQIANPECKSGPNQRENQIRKSNTGTKDSAAGAVLFSIGLIIGWAASKLLD